MRKRGVTFWLTVDGEGVTPRSVDVRVLVELVGKIDAAIRAGRSGDGEKAALSLIGVEPGSDKLQLFVHGGFVDDYKRMANAVANKEASGLPAAKHLADVANFADDKGLSLKIGGVRKVAPALALTGQHRVVVRESVPIRGTTTIYGRVDGVRRKRSASEVTLFRTDAEKLLIADCPRDVAKQISRRYEEEVGVDGEAVWDPVTLELLDFRISSLLPYVAREPSQVLADLDAAKAIRINVDNEHLYGGDDDDERDVGG